MKKLVILLLVAVIAVMSLGSLMSCSEPEPEPTQQPTSQPTSEPEPPKEPVVLKFASAATAGYIPDEQAFVDAFNERCGPDYVIEYYPAGTMLSFVEILDGVRTGAAEMGAVTPNFHSADEPKLGAVELPFLFNNNDAHRYACPKLKPLYSEILESKFNQKLLCLHNYMGMAAIGTTPIKTLEDFDGLLIQSISPVFAEIIEALGAAPVSGQPYTEAYSLLEKGTVDATIQASSSMVSYALYDVAKYMTSAYLVAATHGFSINLDAWNKLPADVQNILVEEAEKASDIIDEYVGGVYWKERDELAEYGVEVYYPPKEELDRWREVCVPIYEGKKEIYPEFLEQVLAIAEEANAKYPD